MAYRPLVISIKVAAKALARVPLKKKLAILPLNHQMVMFPSHWNHCRHHDKSCFTICSVICLKTGENESIERSDVHREKIQRPGTEYKKSESF